jgi:TRAP-type C4-dicarboxylate transport system substrate-binding protein
MAMSVFRAALRETLRAVPLAPAAALVAAAVFAGAAAAQDVTLKFSHFLGPQSFFERDVAQPWKKRVEEKSGGKVKVEVFHGGTPMGGVTKQASQVKEGAVDVALGLRGAEGDRFPGTSVIELPFLIKDSASGSKALWDLYKSGALDAEYKDYKVLALFVHDPGLIHTTKTRVAALADLKGLKLRVPNKTVAAALTHAGAVPVVLQVNEVMPAVEKGELDGIVTNWANPLPKFNDHMKNHTDLKFYTSAFFIVMNKAKYESLPAEAKAAVDAAAGDTLVAELGQLWNKWAEPVRKGADAPGHSVIAPDAAAMAAWREGLAPVTEKYLDELAKTFPGAREAYRKVAELAGR